MSNVIGFKYLFGIHMGLCRGPVNEIIEIKVADKVAWRGSITGNSTTAINSPDLFGGEKGEGGIQGPLTALFGWPDQVAPSELETVLHVPMPGFRRMMTVFFDGLISMMNPYPKAWKFRIRRTTEGWDGACWYPEKATIALIRPVGAGESADTTETVEVCKAFSGIPTLPPGNDPVYGPWELVIVPEGTPTSYGIPYVKQSEDYGSYRNIQLFEGLQYTRVDNLITLVRRPDTESDSFIGFGELVVYIDYCHMEEIQKPIAETLGDAAIKAMNPVHIIYECITNREWGRGLNPSILDDESWRYAATQCFEERFGMCIRWTRTDEIKTFIQTVLDHVGGAIFDDRKTGKIKIRLIRNDYKKADLPIFDKDTGLLEIREADVSAQAAMINEMRVTYRDPVTDQDRTVRRSNLSSLQSADGQINSMSKDYRGIPTPELAIKIAQRDLRALSPSVRRFSITLDRRGYNVTPASLLRIQDLDRGIRDTVVRVGPVDYGRLTDGKITLDVIQDIFGLPQRNFTTIGPPLWTSPHTVRACVGEFEPIEMPYRTMYRLLSTADLAFVDPTSAYLGVVAQEGQPLNTSYNTAVRSGAVEPEDQPPDNSYICEA